MFMKKEQFEQVYENLEKRVTWCDKYLGPIKSKEDLLKLSLKDYLELISECKTLMSEMDKIYAELQHIHGMGNLSAMQQGKLLKLTNQFSTYRSDIKCLSANATLDKIPDIPTSAKYKLSVLGDFTLTRPARGSKAVSEISLNDSAESTAQSVTSSEFSKPVGSFDGRVIKLKEDEIEKFATWYGYYCTLSSAAVIEAIKVGKAYGGIQWMVKEDSYIGAPTNPGNLNRTAKLFAGLINKK